MKVINHLNYFDENNRVYCEKLREVVEFDDDFNMDVCGYNCPFYNGALQGEGVECLYMDSTAEDDDLFISEPDPFLMRHRRLGASAEEEPHRNKQLYGDEG